MVLKQKSPWHGIEKQQPTTGNNSSMALKLNTPAIWNDSSMALKLNTPAVWNDSDDGGNSVLKVKQ